MKKIVLALAGATLAAGAVYAQEINRGSVWAQRVDRNAACSRAIDLAWQDVEATRVSSCRCDQVTDNGVSGYRCHVTRYAAELRAPTPYNRYGNIYNNPYGGTTTVVPGVR